MPTASLSKLRPSMPWVFVVPAGLACSLSALAEAGGDPAGPGLLPAVWGFAGVVLVAFLVAGRFPVTGPLLLLVTFVPVGAGIDIGAGGTQLIAFMLLIGHVGYRRPPRTTLVVTAVVGLASGLTVSIRLSSPWEFVFYPLILSAVAGMGILLHREKARSTQLREMAAELAAQRDARATAAVAQERVRISRELHDAVAHTVSVMTLQAGVVRRRLPEGSPEHAALESVEELGRRSVDELRRVVGLLREDAADPATEPAPSLARLDDLAAQVRATGTPVDVRVRGELTGLPDGLDRSAYRIVQEALSNTVRHAGQATAVVTVEHGPAELTLAVVDTGSAGTQAPSRPGYGLVGMEERVAMFGGELATGPEPHGGFAVRVRFPLPVPSADGVPAARS